MFTIRYQQIPLHFLLEHQSTLAGLGQIGLRTLKKTTPRALDWQVVAPIIELIDPPHMVSQWGLSFATRLLLQTHYPLSQVINQGVSLKMNGKIPEEVKQIDVRFLKPVKLPSQHNQVETSTEQSEKYVRVVGSAGQVCLMGQFK
jgi:hypothetical protein